MDFANEYYVRIYTRDTTTWKRLRFNGQTVLMHVLRKMDQAGVLDVEDMEPWEAAVLHCHIPEDIARAGMDRCLELEVLVHSESYLVAPRYREANEASKSDRQRQLESRSRRRLRALEQSDTSRDRLLRAVTSGHEGVSRSGPTPARCVTEHHTRSQSVTLTGSGSRSGAVAVPSVGCDVTEPPPKPNGSHGSEPDPAAALKSKISSKDVAAYWHRIGSERLPGLMHAHDAWHGDYEIIGAACDRESNPRAALEALVRHFWLAPHGAVVSGRVKHPNPQQLARYVTRDMAEAFAWWQDQQKLNGAREVGEVPR